MRMLLVLLITLTGCTMLQPRSNLPDTFANECTTEECVVEAMDSIANDPSYPGTRYKIMEGYEDTKLKPMLEDGRLDIGYINPVLLVAGGVLGYATRYPGRYGEIYKCTVRVAPWPNWSLLVHELSHCQGYKDRGFLNPFFFNDQYTDKQKHVLESEGVDLWTSTEFYKNQKYITDDYIWNNK